MISPVLASRWAASLAIGLVIGASAVALAQSYSPDLKDTRPLPAPIRKTGELANDWPTGEACMSMLAIEVEFGSFCTEKCVTDKQCPAGWGCKPVPQGNAPPIWLCMPRRILPAPR